MEVVFPFCHVGVWAQANVTTHGAVLPTLCCALRFSFFQLYTFHKYLRRFLRTNMSRLHFKGKKLSWNCILIIPLLTLIE